MLDRPYNWRWFTGFTIGFALLSWLIYHSRFGLQLRAIRDDEDRARGLGVRAMQVKLTAFVLLALAALALLFLVVFPWLEPLLPFDEITLG